MLAEKEVIGEVVVEFGGEKEEEPQMPVISSQMGVTALNPMEEGLRDECGAREGESRTLMLSRGMYSYVMVTNTGRGRGERFMSSSSRPRKEVGVMW